MQQELQFNHSILKRFAVLDQRERLAHAYLFIGPSGIGKTETAVAVAKLMNCQDAQGGIFCDTCSSCIKINTGNHPDVIVIDNGNDESIKIEQIRELLSRNKLRAFMANKKVFIIKNIENLTLDGANAFLKTLEEPAADSLLLLTASALETVLDTVKSRCHMVHFPSMSDHDLAGRLRDDHDVETENARLFAYFAQGSLGAAKKLKKMRFIDKKNGLIDEFILNRPQEASIKSLLAKKDETRNFLNVLLSWMRDALLAKAGVRDNRLIHIDRIDELNVFARNYTFEELQAINGSVVKMCRLLADNLNIKLPLLIIGEQLWGR
ncbi:MAG: AAA family ATPase [Candidatus Omnitrophica bacterium]|nr:AAA family ATPase [Candidatus Omnitrophota bacterium]